MLHKRGMRERMTVAPEGQTKAERMATGSVFTFGSMVVVQLASIVNSIVIVRALGLFDVGIYSVVVLTASVATLTATFGVPSALVKFLAEVPEERPAEASSLLGAGIAITLVATSLSALALVLLSSLFAFLYGQPQVAGLLLIASVGVVLNSLLSPLVATFQAYELIRERGTRNMVASILTVPTTLACVGFWGLAGAIGATVAGGAVSILVNLGLVRALWRNRRLSCRIPRDYSPYRKILGYAIPALIGAILVTPVLWFTSTYLAMNASFGEVGRYSVGSGLAGYLLFIPSAISVPLVPIVSRLDHSNPDELRAFLIKTLRVGAFLLVPPTLVLVAFPGPFLAMLYGSASAAAAPIVQIVAPAAFLSGVASIVGSAIAGRGRMWEGLALNLVWAVVLVASSLLLVPSAEAVGLSFGYLTAYATLFVGVMAYVRYSWGLHVKALALPLLVAFVSYVVLLGVGALVADPWRSPALGVVIVVGSLAELPAMSRREVEVVTAPLRKLMLWLSLFL